MAADDEIIGALEPAAARPTPWSDDRRPGGRDTYWLATVHRDGRPSMAPVLAVWLDGALYFCARGAAGNGRRLVRDPRCSLAVSTPGLDLVVEGRASRVRDRSLLDRVAHLLASEYGWDVAVGDGRVHDAHVQRADASERHDVFEFSPRTALGPATEDTLAPTRWSV